MARFVDLTGKTFGKLKVIDRTVDTNGHLRWVCQCTCGNITRTNKSYQLTSGRTRSCGCGFRSDLEDMTGQKFGSWTFLRLDDPQTTKHIKWICRCDCGFEKSIVRHTIVSGTSTQCRSCQQKNRRDTATGSKHKYRGYVYLFQPGHPNATDQGRVAEHRYLMSELLGRPLLKVENVHHRNGVKDDNTVDGPLKSDPETGRLYSGNLELWSTSQPSGQRPGDKVKWAREIIALYGDMFPEEKNED